MRLRTVIAVGLVLAAAAPSAKAVVLRAGDIVVVDQRGYADGMGGVTKVDPATGQQTPISSNAISSVDVFGAGPRDIVLDASGRILVAENGSEQIVRIDPATGEATIVSNNSISGPDLFVSPIGLALARNGDILVADRDATADGSGAVIRVDAATGAQSYVSNNQISQPDLFSQPRAIALDRSGSILIADPDSPGAGPEGGVIRVDPSSGQQTLISSNSTSPPGFFAFPIGLDLDNAGRILVSDDAAFADASGGVIAVDPVSGAQSVLASNAGFSGPDLLIEPRAAALDLRGRLLVSDADSTGGDDAGAIARFDLSSHVQSLVSNNSVNTGTDLFVDPKGLAVVPPRCFGSYATIYGTTGPDLLRGTAARDVIAGLAGGDRVQGVGGNDLICAGQGLDRILGGRGRDRIKGEGGADQLVGGAGGDRLLGGRGRDRLLGGRARDRLLGGRGGDRLRGGPGRDVLRGGPGRDRQIQ